MHTKSDLREKAIDLRRQGRTYSEILKEVDVAKSTLSLWFHEVELAKHQVQRITQKRIEGQKKGAQARRTKRVATQNEIWSKAKGDIGNISDRELLLIGTSLYWAEGSKEKEWRPGSSLIFSNSDPHMIRVFLVWCEKCLGVDPEIIKFSIYIHESKKHELLGVRLFWSKELGLPHSRFERIYFKRHKITSPQKNAEALYNGQLRVSIPKSTALLRKTEGWARGIASNCRLV